MKFATFLTQCQQPSFWQNHAVICFRAQQYPLLFFSQLFRQLAAQKIIEQPPQLISYALQDHASICTTLAQHFLGQEAFYTLGDVGGGRVDKKLGQTLAFLAGYQGPHRVLFFIASDVKLPAECGASLKAVHTIELENNIDQRLFERLSSALGFESALHKHRALVARIFKIALTVPLETCCMLYNYLELLSAGTAPAFEKYLTHFIEPQKSLHDLAKYFFAKNPQDFFKIWLLLRHDYSDMFWLAFWSGQLWQASFAIHLLKQSKLAEAKRIGYRLPFSFFSRDFRKYSPDECASAHAFLYEADYAIKRGSTFCVMDLFYSHFFLNRFAPGAHAD